MVDREPANKFSLSCLDCSHFLQLLCITPFVSNGSRCAGCGVEWRLFASSDPQPYFSEPASPASNKGITVAPSYALCL
ncbi:hypothetical protein [Methylobacter sp.]|uniref:hypothetical protein n=1 Tax=Methylobacter sp. TaxID=2051955 RepID=UPI0034510563